MLTPLAMMGSVSGILLLRNGRAVVDRLLLLSLAVSPAILLVDAVMTAEWFAAAAAYPAELAQPVGEHAAHRVSGRGEASDSL